MTFELASFVARLHRNGKSGVPKAKQIRSYETSLIPCIEISKIVRASCVGVASTHDDREEAKSESTVSPIATAGNRNFLRRLRKRPLQAESMY